MPDSRESWLQLAPQAPVPAADRERTVFVSHGSVEHICSSICMTWSPQRLNSIVKGRRSVSAGTALLLEALTGCDAQI